MQPPSEDRQVPHGTEGAEAGDWNDSAGTYDPVGAGAALAALEQSGAEPAPGDDQVDALAEYVGRETAYQEAVPPRAR